MKSINRIFAIATLAILFCANAIAQISTMPGRDANGAYLITNASELQWFAEQVNVGNNNIDCFLLDDIEYSGPQIGTDSASPFKGTFDGCFYGLTLNLTCDEYAGLFKYAGNGAVIKNLNIHGSITSRGQYMGFVVGAIPSGRINVERVFVDATCVVEYNEDNSDVKYCAGILGINKNSSEYYIANCAFAGNVVETASSENGLVLAGVIGLDERKANVSSVLNVFMCCDSPFELKSSKDVVSVYPVGDLAINTSKKNYYTSVTNALILQDGRFEYDYPNKADVWELEPKQFSDSTEDGSALSFINPEEYNYEKELIWEQVEGKAYPTLKIPTFVWTGAKNTSNWQDEANWNEQEIPSWNSIAVISVEGNTPTITSDSYARSLKIEAGAVAGFSNSSYLQTKNVEVLGTMRLTGKSTLEAKDINVSESGSLQLEYDYLKNSPSLIYTGSFTGNARLVREFKPNYLMYLGAGIEECSYSDVSPYGMTAFFDKAVNKYTTLDYFFIGYDLENGDVFPGDITTGRVMRLYADEGITNPTMTEIGTPVSSSRKFVVSDLTSGYVALNNPYPYTIDVSQWANKVGTSVAWRELNGSVYTTVTYNLVGKVSNNADPYIAPFKTVTYQVPEGVTSLVLPNVSTRGENHQMLKSASLRDDMIKIQLFVNGSVAKSDEGTLLFMNVGSKDADTDNLDSSVGDLYSAETGKLASPKVVLHKLNYEDGLSIAIYPEAQNMVGVELPVEILLPDYGVSSLEVGGGNAYNFNYDYGVYFCDKMKQQMVNLREESYVVTDLDNMPSNRFCVILVNSGDTPVIPEFKEEESQIPTSIEVTNTGSDLDGVIIRSENGKVIVNNVPDQLVGSPIDVYNTLGVKVSTKEADIDNTIDAGGTGIRAVVVNNSQAKKILVK